MTVCASLNTNDILRSAPFGLDEASVAWVDQCKERLKGERRLAQLFNVMLKPGDLSHLSMLKTLQPGAVTQFTTGGLESSVAAARSLQSSSDIPLLISGDVEGGTICLDGTTPMPNQLGMAALRKEEDYQNALKCMMQEARAIGIDWTFSPVMDVNARFRSAIVGTRSFGSSTSRVASLGGIHIGTVQTAGMAATAKHWPGEGFDDRDQHVLTTVNPLSLEEWWAVFGKLYQDAIKAGVKTIMSGHIAWPAYAHSVGVAGLEAYRPASISRLLNLDLLRSKLGFNGLIVSDATEMAGLTSWSPRDKHLPEIIENGCDMILFSQDLSADVSRLQSALSTGELSEVRVDQALTRILGLKASLGLHRREQSLETEHEIRGHLRKPACIAVSRHVSAESITLVKDVQCTLPLRPDRHRRITVITQTADSDLTPFSALSLRIPEMLRSRGFEIKIYDPNDPPRQESTDLLLYVLAHESLMTSGAIYFDWRRLHGPMWHAMRRYWHEIPNVLISLGHPYYLYEAPRMPCVINAYSAIEPVQEAVVRKLVGEEDFVGLNPIDPFCGLEDARY